MSRFVRFFPAIFISIVTGFCGVAAAGDRTVGVEAQRALGITVYNNGLAMVRDVRAISLEKGKNRLAFEEVSGQIQPETASLRPAGKLTFSLVEQNFDFDLLTPGKLTEKAVGSRIDVVRVNPASGVETREEAIVLSANEGVVLKFADRIESLGGEGFSGRLVFKEIPANLRARPTLSMTLDSETEAAGEVELAYLTQGLSWAADYVGRLNAGETRLDLQAWVTMNNSSGASYHDATLQLVAGEVHRVHGPMNRVLPGAVMMEMKVDQAAEREELSDYQLYTVPFATTIANNQTKQVALFAAPAVEVRKRLESASYGFSSVNADRSVQTIPVSIFLTIENKKEKGLGLPLPKGIMRIYKADSQGRSQFVGEDAIGQTPKNETAELYLGEAFDVTLRRRQESYRSFNRESTERGIVTVHQAGFEVVAKNARDREQEVTVTADFSGDWKITAENLAHEKRSATFVAWTLKVPANGDFTLKYTVETEVRRPQR